MGAVYKKTVTKPLSAGAKIIVRKGQRLAEALATLHEAQREALVLRHCQGLSLAAISQHLGRSPAAVAGLLKRGLRELRVQLGERG
jgi:RNA polymerase sigma factor (sigma-70 family)